MTLEEKKKKYAALTHAMQTGVAYKMERAPAETTPQHLRVGVNCAMSEQGALVGLLMKKGIITEDEYLDALIESMEGEVQSYQTELTELYGAGRHIKITLA